MDGPVASAFEDASSFFVRAVESAPDDAWTRVALGEWDLRSLVAHGNRAHTTVEDYLLRPQSPEPPGSGYFSEEAIRQRAKEAVVVLGDDPKGAVAAASARVLALVQQTPADATLGSPAGTMTLAAYLPSRVAELTIHGLDIVRANGSDLAAPAPAVLESLQFLAGRVVKRGDGELLLLALSGRAELPPGFSVY